MGGMGGTGRRPIAGEDEQVEVRLSFEEAVFGLSKDVEVRRLEPCETCDGSGEKPGSTPTRCGECNGAGVRVNVMRTPLGVFQQQMVRL
jgi:molecular chaperone DnaJ